MESSGFVWCFCHALQLNLWRISLYPLIEVETGPSEEFLKASNCHQCVLGSARLKREWAAFMRKSGLSRWLTDLSIVCMGTSSQSAFNQLLRSKFDPFDPFWFGLFDVSLKPGTYHQPRPLPSARSTNAQPGCLTTCQCTSEWPCFEWCHLKQARYTKTCI